MRWLLAILVVALHGVALGAPRLAIHPLRSQGASPEAMQQLDAALRHELAKVEGLQLVEGAGSARDCGAQVECLAAWGQALRAQEVLWGEVRAMPDSYSVTLRLLDVATARELAKTSGSYNRDVEEMVWAARAQITQLKSPGRHAGRLLLEAPAAARATVNGSAVDAGAALVLKPGLHEVRIAEGRRAAQAWIEVRFEQTTTARLSGEPAKIEATWAPWSAPLAVEFDDVAPPPAPALAVLPPEALASALPAPQTGWPRWPGIAALGAGAALAGVGIYELVQSRALRSDLEALRGPDGGVPPSQADLARRTRDDMNLARLAGSVLVGTGAALVVGGTAYLVFAPAPGGGQLAVGGSF